MHGDFEPTQLPHERAAPDDYSGSDVSTYRQIWDAAKKVYDDCTSGKFHGATPSGWYIEGTWKLYLGKLDGL